MKLFYSQRGQLKKHLWPFYHLCSEDPALIEACLTIILEASRAEGFTEVRRWTLETGASENLAPTLTTRSLFSEKEILVLTLPTTTLDRSMSDMLASLCTEPLKNCVVIVCHHAKPNQEASRAAWAKKIEKHGVFMALWPPRAKESTSPDNASSGSYDTFSLAEAIEQQHLARATLIFKRLCEEHVPAQLLLWALTRSLEKTYDPEQARAAFVVERCVKGEIQGDVHVFLHDLLLRTLGRRALPLPFVEDYP